MIERTDKQLLSLIPLRGMIIYPHLASSLYVGRDISLKSLDYANRHQNQIILSAQRDPDADAPKLRDIYRVGTRCTLVNTKRLPDGTVKTLIEGVERVEIHSINRTRNGYICSYSPVQTSTVSSRQAHAMRNILLNNARRLFKGHEKGDEMLNILQSMNDLERFIDMLASCCQMGVEEKQTILEMPSLTKRFDFLARYIKSELEIADLDKRIHQQVREQIDRGQKEYYLNEQVKAIRRELGGDGESKSEIEELEEQIARVGLPKEAREKADSELCKLKTMAPMSAEATVVRSYLDWLLELPWQRQTIAHMNIKQAEKILNKKHYGLKEVKERILEYLAIYQRVEKNRTPLLLLVGPPGVGKTSLGEAIAEATGRKLVRFSLGGVRDEAEIRGHRRTYIGSMPGKILQKLAKAKVNNPLFLLDEVDKMAMDFRGDPAAALLEALDPEQNTNFNDHYLEIDYDLSNVLFLCTANSLNVSPALLDRMEVIRLPGYTDDEKISIAKKHLVPKQLALCGLTDQQVSFTRAALQKIIDSYTREAGVRELERQISKALRKLALDFSRSRKEEKKTISSRNLEIYLGVERYSHTKLPHREHLVGQASGLAWTSAGGEILTIEAAVLPGSGKLIKTGHLGEVMQESIQAAISVVRSRSQALNIEKDFYQKCDYHIHVPEGATPKDGPSAGLAICLALISCFIGVGLRRDVAMTGEITLRGEVLRIGGLKEKLLAAQRSQIKRVIIPEDNRRDLKEISSKILAGLDVKPVRSIDEALVLAFAQLPKGFDIKKFAIIPTFHQKTNPNPISAH